VCEFAVSFVLVASHTSFALASVDRIVIEVAAGARDRRDTPVVVALPEGLGKNGALAMESTDGHVAVSSQVVAGSPPSLVFLLDELAAGRKRRYEISNTTSKPTGIRVKCEDDGKALNLSVQGRRALSYQHATVEAPEGLDRIYRRSGQIHPLTTPLGRVVTDDFSPDHAHQHGLFFAWVNTTFNDRKVDFWNQQQKTGTVRHVETHETTGGPVFAQFVVKLRHEDVTEPDKPAAALDEVCTVRLYRVLDRFLIDYESRQTCASNKPLQLHKYIYGGLGVRGNRAWLDPNAKGDEPPNPGRSGGSDFLTSEGKRRKDGNHTRPRWVDLSGKVDGETAGVSVLVSPANFRFPQPVRLHPTMPYFSISPVVVGEFSIIPGETYVSRYRIVVHDGPPDAATLDRLWSDFAEPPRVVVVESR
jgi:Methane oxygenase PmoA